MRGLASLLEPPETRTINESDVPWTSATKVGSTNITETSALTLSAVWACETLIADSIATLPVDTCRKQGATRLPTTPPAWLDRPNPETRRVDYETARVLSLVGWGNAYSLLVRRGGTSDSLDPVIERWLIAPGDVNVRREPKVGITYTVQGLPVPAGNIHHVRGYTLPGECLGMSVISQARQSMGVGASAGEYASKFFSNGVVPSGVLEVPSLPAEASKDVVDRLRDTFAERHAGTGNSYKPVVLTGGTTWKQITLNPADAQFLETRKFEIEEIARWFRCPLHKIQQIMGNASQGGGNGLEQMDIEFSRDTLLPWTVRLEQADSELVPRGQYVRFNVDAYVRADLKTRYEAHKIARDGGWKSADDIRQLEDEQPLPDGQGEAYWRPANMIEVGSEPEAGSQSAAAADDTQGDPSGSQ